MQAQSAAEFPSITAAPLGLWEDWVRLDDERRSHVMTPSRGAAARRRRGDAAGDGDRPLLLPRCEQQSARCLPAAESANPGKHGLSCNPEKRGVEFIAGGAAA